MSRPPIPIRPLAPGHVWRPVPAPSGWHVSPGHPCRGRPCNGRSILAMQRGRDWWPYCPAHSYGRWVENGQIMVWAQVRGETPVPK